MTLKQAVKQLKKKYPDVSDETWMDWALTFIGGIGGWTAFMGYVQDNIDEIKRPKPVEGEPIIIRIADYLPRDEKGSIDLDDVDLPKNP